MRKGMISALVSSSLYVCMLFSDSSVQILSLELQVALWLLNYPHRHSELMFSLSDLSRIC